MSKVKMIPKKYIDKIIEKSPNAILMSTTYLLYIFNGIRECSDEMTKIYNHKFSNKGISDNCHDIRSDYKGYVFKFTYNTI